MRSHSRVIGAVLAVSLVTQLTACGSLLYPDRRGQIQGQIDPAVAILDAIGLLFWIVPGLIAFAIDFTTGAIYLPGGKYSIAPETLHDAIGPNGEVDKAKLKAIILRETGQSVPLDNPNLIQQRGSLQQLASAGLIPAA
jgi:hypothetical protein